MFVGSGQYMFGLRDVRGDGARIHFWNFETENGFKFMFGFCHPKNVPGKT
jgi:hypothetical protein